MAHARRDLYLIFQERLWNRSATGIGVENSISSCSRKRFREVVFRGEVRDGERRLGAVGRRSSTESEDLGVLVRRLCEAVEPLGEFHEAGRRI